ncbi:MAG: hypothetical protein LAO31_23145 [Acidobacteriia bacterium]|nr:hypothetical protein [Terriglobia bacterium]
MTEEVKTGTILIRDNTPLPEGVQVECEPYSRGWRLVNNLDGSTLDRRITKAGCTFFYLAGEFKGSAFGSDRERTQGRAVRRILSHLKSEKFNCLEITRVESKRFLGIPYVTVLANARHIQQSVFLFQGTRLPDWDRAKLAAA